jgi:hypothetical protein
MISMMNRSTFEVGQSDSCVSPDRLKMLGKQASLLFTDRAIPLTDAVVRVVSENPGLNVEHIRRVTEMANNYAFETLFNKTAGDHRVINFEDGPADPAAILNELNAAPKEKVKMAYRAPPKINKFIPGAEGIERAFDMVKQASPMDMTMWENPHRSVFELQEMLKAAQSQMASDMQYWGDRFEEASDQLYKEARKVVLEGHSPAEVSIIFQKRAVHPGISKLALKQIADRMDWDSSFVSEIRPMEKLAENMVVNSNHPLCVAFDYFTKVAAAHYAVLIAAEKINQKIEVVNNKVRELIQ